MFEKTTRKNLLAIVAAYRKATGKSLSDVSRTFYGRGNFFAQFKTGERTLSIKNVEALLDKFRAGWPKNAAWPRVRTVSMDRHPTD